MGTPFKMKGSPMQRNFGVGAGSPLPVKKKPGGKATDVIVMGEGSTIFGKSVEKIKHALSPTTGILSPKNISASLKGLWKKHGPTINVSTKNPKGIGK